MDLQREIRDLLTESYSRINELNGLMNRRDMEEALDQNALTSKLKARNIFTNLHQLLDAFYRYLLESVDSAVLEMSDNLRQHSSESDEYVAYMAKICLIAETFLRDKTEQSKMEGLRIKEKLSECLVESGILKNVDYDACASIDIDFDKRALFALPFMHIVSHGSADSGMRKLQSLKFEDLKQLASNSAPNREQKTESLLTNTDPKSNAIATTSSFKKASASSTNELLQPALFLNIPGTSSQGHSFSPSNDFYHRSDKDAGSGSLVAISVDKRGELDNNGIPDDRQQHIERRPGAEQDRVGACLGSLSLSQSKHSSKATSSLLPLPGFNFQGLSRSNTPGRLERNVPDVLRNSADKTSNISDEGYYKLRNKPVTLLSSAEWAHRE